MICTGRHLRVASGRRVPGRVGSVGVRLPDPSCMPLSGARERSAVGGGLLYQPLVLELQARLYSVIVRHIGLPGIPGLLSRFVPPPYRSTPVSLIAWWRK